MAAVVPLQRAESRLDLDLIVHERQKPIEVTAVEALIHEHCELHVLARHPVGEAPSGRGWWGGCQSVAAHHFTDSGEIGWAARGGCEDPTHVLEVSGPEHARGCDRQELRVDASAILEPVDLTASDAQG